MASFKEMRLAAKRKRLYKFRGTLLNWRMVNATLMEFIVVKGKQATFKSAVFKTFSDEIKSKVDTCDSKARLLIRFDIDSKNWQGKWHTDLWAVEIEDWPIGADAALRAAKQKAIQDNINKKIQESSANTNLGLFNGIGEFE